MANWYETVVDKPAFRVVFKKWRSIIPADGFFEWEKGKSTKQPYLVRMKDDLPFAFAGLWEAIDRMQFERDDVADSMSV